MSDIIEFVAHRERIAIVGAGVIGCAIAFELSRRGAAVTIFDGRSIGGGATQASAGILAPYTEGHAGGRLFDLTVRGLHLYDDFVAAVRSESRVPFEYRRLGTIEIADDEERASALKSRVREAWAATARLEWLDGDSLRTITPAVTARALGGLLCPVHGHIGVRAFTSAMADAAVQLGATFVDHTLVRRVERTHASIEVHTATAVSTFDRVVLCAGAWTPELDPLAQTVGKIRPVRGQLVRLRHDPGAIRHVVWGASCYLVPWEDGTVLVGATSEEVGFDERATASGVEGLLAAAVGVVPSLGTATFLDVWVGLRPAAEEGIPILGPSRDPRIMYAAGHYRNGVLLAPLSASLIADYVFTNATDPSFVKT